MKTPKSPVIEDDDYMMHIAHTANNQSLIKFVPCGTDARAAMLNIATQQNTRLSKDDKIENLGSFTPIEVQLIKTLFGKGSTTSQVRHFARQILSEAHTRQ